MLRTWLRRLSHCASLSPIRTRRRVDTPAALAGRPLRLEQLEMRELLASNFAITFDGGLLKITGTDANDYILVQHVDELVKIECVSQSGRRTLDNHLLAGVSDIRIDGGAGNDVIELISPLSSAPKVTVYGGEGRDLINAVSYAGPADLSGNLPAGEAVLIGADDGANDLLIKGERSTVFLESGDKSARLSNPIPNPVAGSDGSIATKTDGRFGAPRSNSFGFHEGVDIRAADGLTQGQLIYPVASGTVIVSGDGGSSTGYRVLVQHQDYFASYQHLMEPTEGFDFPIGEVFTHTPLGKMGRTGNVQTNGQTHLHLRMDVRDSQGNVSEFLIPNIEGAGSSLIYRPDTAYVNEVRLKDELLRQYLQGIRALGGQGMSSITNDRLDISVPVLDQPIGQTLDAGSRWGEVFNDDLLVAGSISDLTEESGTPSSVQTYSASSADTLLSATSFDGEEVTTPASSSSQVPDVLAIIRARLEEYGFTVEQAAYTSDERGDLLRAHGRFTFAGVGRLDLGGGLGFDYFDGAIDAELQGELTVSAAPVVLDVTFGIDLVEGWPSFWVAESSRLGFEMRASGTGTGNMGIGSLVNVDVGGRVSADLWGGLTLDDPDTDGKLRLLDLESGSSYRGQLDGSIGLDATFTTALPVLPPLTWKGSGALRITDGVVGNTHFAIDTASIDVGKFLKDLVKGFFDARNGFSILGPLSKLFNAELPYVGGTLGSHLGVSEELNWLLTTVDTSASDLTGLLTEYGIETNISFDTLWDVIHGRKVDLLTFHAAGGDRWEESYRSPTLPIIIGPFSVNVGLEVGAHVGWGYEVGLGIDTTGFYVDSSTHVRAYGGVRSGVRGDVEVLGFLDIAEASLGVGLDVSARLGLHDPDPTDGGRIYLDEIFRGDLAQSFLDVLTFEMVGELTGYARVELTPPWPLPDITLVDTQINIGRVWGDGGEDRRDTPVLTQSQRKRRPVGDQVLPVDYLQPDGTLLLPGDDRRDRVTLSQEGETVVVTWGGRGKGRYDGVNLVKFLGAGDNDRLDVVGDFHIPIVADGGAGDDVLRGGLGGDVLIGGEGADVLRGGDGTDRLEGQDGDDLLVGDAGDDLLLGGIGHDQLRGGDEDDTLDGGSGDDYMEGGAGDDLLTAGTGRNVLHGNSGADILIGGDEADQLYGGSEGDTLEGNGSDDHLDGGSGNDTVYGGGGRDNIQGGVGDDILNGGSNDDVVYGGSGSDGIHGRDGDDQLFGEAGNDTLYGDDGNDTLYGGDDTDSLYGDDNDLTRGTDGNDRLHGGKGRDTVNGEGGQDILAIDFASVGDGVADDYLSGGPDRDWLAVAGTDRDDHIELIQTGPASFLAVNLNPADGVEIGRFTFSLLTGPMITLEDSDIEQVGMDGGLGNDVLTVGDSVLFDVALWGGEGDDVLTGGAGYDRLEGGAGNDQLLGRGGNDELFGGSENDILDGGEGSDRLFGGTGMDTLHGGGGRDIMHGDADTDWLHAGSGLEGVLAYGGDGEDWLYGGEGIDVLDGGNGNDHLFGGAMGDYLTGGDGDDELDGQAGRDMLRGGEGDDTLRAGDSLALPAGTDWVEVYQGFLSREIVLMGLPELNIRGRIPEIEDMLKDTTDPTRRKTLEEESTTLQNEVAWLNQAQTDLLPRQSVVIDMLMGEAGNDTLYGSDRPDFISGDGGNDVIYHSEGADVISGGEGTDDTYRVQGKDTAEVIALTAVTRNEVEQVSKGSLLAAVVIDGVEAARLQDNDIEIISVDAGGGDDRVTVQFGNQAVRKVEMIGGKGNDVLDARGVQTKAYLYGGDDNDTLHGTEQGDTLEGGNGDDKLYGYGGSDTVIGGLGADWIEGASGDDTLYGDLGDGVIGHNDRIFGGLGADHIRGDGGDDYLIGDLEDGVTGQNDYILGGLGADHIRGDGGDDYLVGDRGDGVNGHNDYILGGYGADRIYGDGGDDYLSGDLGNSYYGHNDYILGGYGADRIYGDGADDYLVGDLGDGVNGHNDYVLGGHGADSIYGDGGDDYLVGDIGDGSYGYNDFIKGGYGADSIYGDGGNDYLIGDLGDGYAGHNDSIVGGYGADSIYGDGGNDSLVGDCGSYWYGDNDTIRGGAGSDKFYGNGGNDWMYDVYDTSGNVLSGEAGDDKVYGGYGNDYLYGGDGSDYLDDTYGGNNTLDGAPGNDTLCVGTGTYYRYFYHSESEVNYVYCGDGNDEVHGIYSLGCLVVSGGNGDDYIRGGGGHDYLYGEGGNDTIFGNLGDDRIWGGYGNDLLVGDENGGSVGTGGADRLFGEGGSDQLHGGWGNDYLDGGYDWDVDYYYGQWGNDTFAFYYYWVNLGWYGGYGLLDQHDYNWMSWIWGDSIAYYYL